MFKSIHTKLLGGVISTILVFAVTFSIFVYSVATYLIDNHVLPAFDNSLRLNAERMLEKVDPSLVQEADNGSQEAYDKLIAYLSEEKHRLGVENIYVLAQKDGKEYIVGLSEAPDMRNVEYPFTPEMKEALAGTPQLSSIYEDEYGVHKSAFMPIQGTHAILGIDMDARFVHELERFILTASAVGTLVMTGAGSAVAFFLARNIIRPLHQLVSHTRQVAAGDLREDLEVRGSDEVAQLAASFNEMSQQLRTMIRQVSATSTVVADSSRELSNSSAAIAQMANETSSAIQEVASGTETMATGAMESAKAMEEMAHGIQHIVESATVISEKSSDATREAEQGNQVIGTAIQQMSAIRDAVSASAQSVRLMNERANEIGQVVEFITNIAGQINLLALNAAIEAARAGESGRGFAVVADEVRKLAEQSAHSASEITSLLNGIQDESLRSVQSMDGVAQEVERGTELVEDAGSSFRRIVSLIEELDGQIQSVSAVLEQFSASTEEITASTEQTVSITQASLGHTRKIAASTQEQLASIEESAEAAHRLNEKAEELRGLVARFRV